MSTTLLSANRVRNGRPAQAELIAQYKDTGEGLPVLTICRDWRPTLSRWAKETSYRCEEVPCGCGGRGFILYRDPANVAKDGPDADTEYQVRVANRQDYSCTCLGCLRHGYCCHVSALLALLAGGFIDTPCADRKPEPAYTGEAPF